MSMAQFLRGKPIMQNYTVPVSCNAGDVIVIGDLPCVAHEAIPSFTGGLLFGDLAVAGGIYLMTADAAYPVGTRVYWDPSAQKVTTSSTAGTYPFGVIVGGATDALSDAASTTCSVFHDPSGGGGSLIYQLGASANDNISNTNAETAFATTAVIPAASLEAGDVVHVRAVVKVLAQNSTNTNDVKLKISTAANTFTTVIDAGAKNLAANALVVIDVDLLFSAVGNGGSFQAVGLQTANDAAGNTAGPVTLAATSINTNLACTVEVTDTQSAASTGNNAQLVLLDVTRKRK